MSEPIDCREALARLQDYLKQELTPELAAEVQAHLEHCRPCFEQARFEQSFLRDAGGQGPGAPAVPTRSARASSAVLRAEQERG